MEISKPFFKKYIFICENHRPDAPCCMPEGSQIREEIKKRIKQLGLSNEIRVSRSGCLDTCADGPNVLVMPDQIWFKKVQLPDVEVLVDKISKG